MQNLFRLFSTTALILAFGSISILTNAQQASGDQVTTSDGRILFGEIQRDYDKESYNSIRIILNDGKKMELGPNEVLEFRLENGRYFQSKILPEKEGKVFVQVIISGEINLYRYQGTFYAERGYELLEMRVLERKREDDGQEKTQIFREYLGILNLLMANSECSLIREPGRTNSGKNINESELVRIIENFHLCENLPYVLHVEKIPLGIISPVFKLGVSHQVVSYWSTESQTEAYLENPLNFGLSAFLKFHQLRGIPRISFEIGVGFWDKSNTIKVQQDKINTLEYGEEKYNVQSLFIPAEVSYSVFRKNGFDVFMGFGGSLWFEKFKSHQSYQDYKIKNQEVIYASTEPFTQFNTNHFSPSVKLGFGKTLSNESGLLVELRGDFFKDNYQLQLEQSNSVHSGKMFSILLGYQFK